MKKLVDHIFNLKAKNIECPEIEIKLIYEMLMYELEGTSVFRQNLEKAIAKVMGGDLPCEKVEMNFNTFKNFRGEKDFVPITDSQILKTGKYGSIWGVDVYVNRDLQDNEIIAYPLVDSIMNIT